MDKMVENMMMQMLLNQRSDFYSSCNNRTCNSKGNRKSRGKRKHRRKCKRRSKCSSNGAASIICVTKCMKKCRKVKKSRKCRPCSRAKKCKRIRHTSCSSRSSTDHNFCTKCGQPLPGVSLPRDNPQNYPKFYQETNSKICVGGGSSPEETYQCISCHTQTTCSQSRSCISSPNLLNPCSFFDPHYFLGKLNRCTTEDLCRGNTNTTWPKLGKQKYLERVTSQENNFKTFSNPADAGKVDCSGVVRIKRCGKNIVTIRCAEDGDPSSSCMNEDHKVWQIVDQNTMGGCRVGDGAENTHCSTAAKCYTGSCITKFRCDDYSSTSGGATHYRVKDCEQELQVPSCPDDRHKNTGIGYGPCSDRASSRIHRNQNICQNSEPYVVRMKFVNPCHEYNCEVEPYNCENGQFNNTRSAHPFCDCPVADCYEDDFGDVPYPTTYDPYPSNYTQNVPMYPPSPPMAYHQPDEYGEHDSIQSSPSGSLSASRSPSNGSLPPKNLDCYDFFYGTVKPINRQ